VADAYRAAFREDSSVASVRNRIEELIPEVSSSIGYRQNSFSDSDGFRRSLYSIQGSVPFRDGLRITPFYRYYDMAQFRRIGGGDCFADNPGGEARLGRLSEEICGSEGTAGGHSGGVRVTLAADPRFSFSGEVSQTRFSLDRNRLNAEVNLTLVPAGDSALTFAYVRRDAVFDVNTIGSLFGGVLGETFYAAYRQPIAEKWNFSVLGGATRYDNGTLGLSPKTLQRRASARVIYRVTPSANAGYFMRYSSFTKPSPLFFSPSMYAVAGAAYDWNKRISDRFRFLGEAELGFGRLKRFDTSGLTVTEFAIYAGIEWRIRPDLNLRLGYRLSRGVSSAFGSPVYRTGMFDFGMDNYLAVPLRGGDPSAIDVR
jgi:hypothetical protein